MPKVLVVHHDPRIALLYAAMLRLANWSAVDSLNVIVATDVAGTLRDDALACLRDTPGGIDAVFCEFTMADFLAHRSEVERIGFVLVDWKRDPLHETIAYNILGAGAYVAEPFTGEENDPVQALHRVMYSKQLPRCAVAPLPA